MSAATSTGAAPRHGPVARVLSGLGGLCITAGLVLLLFCAYQLWWTNVEAAQARGEALADLRTSWTSSGQDYGVPAKAPPTTRVPEPVEGEPFATFRIPRLGSEWTQPVVEGIEAEQLSKGVGHYVGTALPGQLGNLALAGHRATNGEPFRDLDRMREGDEIIVETRSSTYTYVVDRPWVLVRPSAVEMIAPVPGEPGVRATEPKLTLTTCNPRWASTERLIVEARLRSTVARG